ncbi:MAG: folylpolyglutamate synthase/dihydrofolate synthase family protein [Roseiflexaceae bacterium]
MNYQAALDFLYQFVDQSHGNPRPDPNLNLQRTTALLEALGRPQDQLRCVVIAGTKGKGSTAAMLESITRAAGLRTGLWSSPHLHSYRERIQINRTLIREAELIDLVQRVAPLIRIMQASPLGAPATFAIGFGIALRYFADRQVDLAILEVGLGGRYDSANTITPVLSMITSISYDHMEILGNTLAAIAWDKAGILKPTIPSLTVDQDSEALESISQVAEAIGSPQQIVYSAASNPNPPTFHSSCWFDPYQIYQGSHATTLGGSFQRQNARLAVAAALQLRQQGFAIPDSAIAAGLANATWPARFEIVPGTPPIVIDGAHNGDSAARLAESLREHFPAHRPIMVFGASRGKDIPRILDALIPITDHWVLTRADHPRAIANLDTLRIQIQQLNPHAQIAIEADPAEALRHAKQIASSEQLVVVTGSLFLAAAAREAVGLAEEIDPPPT